MTGQMKNQVKIIRWSRPVALPSGVISDICCRTGDMKEILEYAERVARENGVAVEAVI